MNGIARTPSRAPGRPGPLPARYRAWRWRIFGITWLAYAGFYLTRAAFSVAKIELLKPPVGLTSAQLGWIDLAYLTAYAAGQFVWGVAGDRVGSRRIVAVGLALSAAAAALMGSVAFAAAFAALMAVQGLAQSTGWAPLSKNLSDWFAIGERGRVFGWWCTNYAIGALVGAPLAGWFAERFLGWRWAFFGPAAAVGLIGLLFLLLQRDRPEDVGLPSAEDAHGETRAARVAPGRRTGTTWTALAAVARNRMVQLMALVYFLLKPTRYAVLFWGPLFINETFGTGMVKSATLSVVFALGGPLGTLAAGYASDRLFGARRIPYCVLALGGLAATLASLSLATRAGFTSQPVLVAHLFLMGFFLYGPDSLLSGTAAVDFGTRAGASTAVGLINGAGSVGAMVGGSLPGFVKAQWGWAGIWAALAGSILLAAACLAPAWNLTPDHGAGRRRRD